MIYTVIDTFYLSDEQLKNSPSRKDGIDEESETMLRIYGCDLIQECGILLRLPQAVMATGQVLFHRFYCKKSFAKFSVKRVAASCVWLASKLEECPRRAKQVIIVFQRVECRRENLPIQFMDNQSKKYAELKQDLVRTERHLLKEMGFVCHVEHPHKFISNYLRTLETPPELLQEAWNLANDSLRTTLCIRFKSEVVACGVVYAAARRFHVALPENLPWWLAFDADKAGVDEVCRVLAHLYSLPKAQYIKVFKDNDSFTSTSKNPEQIIQVDKDDNCNSRKDVKSILDKVKDSKKNGDDNKCLPTEVENKEDTMSKPKGDYNYKSNANTKRREKEREKARDYDSRGRESKRDSRGSDSDHDSKGRDCDRDRERERERVLERNMERDRWLRSKDKGAGLLEKPRHHSSRDRSECHASHLSREWDRHGHHH